MEYLFMCLQPRSTAVVRSAGCLCAGLATYTSFKSLVVIQMDKTTCWRGALRTPATNTNDLMIAVQLCMHVLPYCLYL